MIQVVRFFLFSLAVVVGFYALGYYPAESWDPPRGSLGLISGLTVALLLMTASFVVMRWALFRSQRIFLIVFGVGFIARLVIFIAIFFAYSKLVEQAVATFAISFAACYMTLSLVEFLCLKVYMTAKKE